MKKTARILSMVMLLVLLASQMIFAAGLEVTEITPADGTKGMQISNMAVKIRFSEPMISDASVTENPSKFKITDAEGTEIPFQVVYSEEKYPNELWLIVEGELVSNTQYTVQIAPGVVSKSGNTLDAAVTSYFNTRNVKTDSLISTVMMVGMMGVMFYATSQATKKQQEAQGQSADGPKQMNPYKLAKEKGISLEEANAIVEKEKEKEAKRSEKYEAAKKQKEAEMAAEVEAYRKQLEEEYEAARHANNFRVKGPGSLVAHGHACPKSVVKKNKARREAAKKAEKARK
ncbi:MAG: Ig-like domain-containing protein [Firmicutes bacterium]|nr:Ig-like domain-containing protein [Bacillota bacterium]